MKTHTMTTHTQSIRSAIRGSIETIRRARDDRNTLVLLGENTTLTLGAGSLMLGNPDGGACFAGRWGQAGTYWFSPKRAREVAKGLGKVGVKNVKLVTWNDARDYEEKSCVEVIRALWGMRH